MRIAACLFLIVLGWLPAAAFAAGNAEKPFELPALPTAHVNDYSHTLTSTAFTGLEQRFSALEQKTGHQAAVAIFQTIGDNSIEDVATRLFEKWRLGAKMKDDGLLLVIAIQEHKLRIEVGYGLEGQIPDALAGRIIRQDIVPFLKQGQLATGILSFERRLEQLFGVVAAEKKQKPLSFSILAFLIMIVIIGMRLLSQAGYDRTLGSGGISGRRGGFWGGGFWGGGGWSGGGGLSGGGGASGSW